MIVVQPRPQSGSLARQRDVVKGRVRFVLQRAAQHPALLTWQSYESRIWPAFQWRFSIGEEKTVVVDEKESSGDRFIGYFFFSSSRFWMCVALGRDLRPPPEPSKCAMISKHFFQSLLPSQRCPSSTSSSTSPKRSLFRPRRGNWPPKEVKKEKKERK